MARFSYFVDRRRGSAAPRARSSAQRSTDPVKGVPTSDGKLIARSPASQPAARAWPCRDGGDAALAPRPPPMVGDIPPCPRVVSRATLPEPVAASRWLYPPPFLLACVATTSLFFFLVLHRNLATALADVR